MLKLIQIDGYNRDSVADILILDNLNKSQALTLLEAYCQAFGNEEIWFKVVSSDYILSRGMEDLV